MNVNISDMRIPYKLRSEIFLEEDLKSLDPMKQFEAWFEEACNNKDVIEPNGMCLATATKDGMPSCRMVLLKGFHCGGFEFFTNYKSRKGIELAENPKAALCLYWTPMNRSIRVEGSVKKISEDESRTYFNSRPRGSQIGASISPQSQPIPNREFLDEKQKEMEEIFGANQQIPKPDEWGGYLVIPDKIEFWQGQSTRIHDRVRFRQSNTEESRETFTHEAANGWVYERLAP